MRRRDVGSSLIGGVHCTVRVRVVSEGEGEGDG